MEVQGCCREVGFSILDNLMLCGVGACRLCGDDADISRFFSTGLRRRERSNRPPTTPARRPSLKVSPRPRRQQRLRALTISLPPSATRRFSACVPFFYLCTVFLLVYRFLLVYLDRGCGSYLREALLLCLGLGRWS